MKDYCLVLSSIALCCTALGCSDPDETEGVELAFHGEQSFLKGFSYDTGYLPAGSPIQVKLELSSGGAITADARGKATGDQLQPTAGSGAFKLAGKVTVIASLKIDIAGKKYEGPIPNAPEIAIDFGDNAAFEPFLLDGEVKLDTKVPQTELAKIPLAGALSAIPGVKGDLTISASGTLKSAFSGVCAKAAGGVAQYTGKTATSGTLKIIPVVEISIPLVGSKKLDSLTVDVPIPAVNSDLDLGSFNVADGTKAATTLCSGGGADGGVDGPAKGDGPAQGDGPAKGDGPTVGDGPATGDGGTSCTKDADCIALDDGTTSQGKCISGSCRMECLLDYFDVNGLTGDGCEVKDTYFDISTEAKAYLMADTDDCATTKTLSLPIPSDDLWHVATGGYLTFGTEKWVKVKIADKLCTLSAKATFDVSKLPSSHTYRVDTRYVCKGGVSSALSGKSVTGGSSASLSPTIPCPGLDDTGTLYMRVYQLSGGHSTTAVKISVEP